MRIGILLLATACGSLEHSSEFGPSTDAHTPTQSPFDARPGPDEDSDAALALGAPCTPGEVRVIATSPTFVAGPYVDDSFVYWLESETAADADATQGSWWAAFAAVHRVSKSGGAASRLFAFDQLRAPSLALDGANVFWTDDASNGFGSLMRGDTDGSSAVALVSGVAAPRALALAGTTLFFISGDALMSIDADGSNESMLATGAASATELVVGASSIDFVVRDQPMLVPRTGGPMKELIVAPKVVDATYEGMSIGGDGYVYMFEATQTKTVRVVRVPTDRGGVEVVALTSDYLPLEPTPGHVTAWDAGCVFYTTYDAIWRVCGEDARVIAPGPVKTGLAFDTTSVYWASAAAPPVLYSWCKN